MDNKLTDYEQMYVLGLLESERQSWEQARYKIAMETLDNSYSDLCNSNIKTIDAIKQKLRVRSEQDKTQEALAKLKSFLENNQGLAELVDGK